MHDCHDVPISVVDKHFATVGDTCIRKQDDVSSVHASGRHHSIPVADGALKP